MKKIIASALLLSGLAFSFAISANAASVVEQDKGYISVSVSESKEIAPNAAEISINVETSDKSLQKATDDNKVISNNVYNNLKTLLDLEKGDYVKTSDFRVNPVYVVTKENKRVFDKYVVSNTVLVKTKNTEIVAKLIDAAISQGATNINNLQFAVSNYDSVCNQTLAELTKKAYKEANSIATAINSRVVGIKSIESSCNADEARPAYRYLKASGVMETANAPSTAIESGKVKIYANLNASFYVK